MLCVWPFPTNLDGFSPYFPPFLSLYRRVGVHALVPSVTEWFHLDQASRPTKIMAPTYQTFADEESLLSQPPKSIKVVEPSTIYLKDGSGATLVELDVELKVD